MGTAIKHPVKDRVKQSFVIFDIWALMYTADHQWQQWTSNGYLQTGSVHTAVNYCEIKVSL